ncbi:MAG: hypothetical protein ACI3XF_08685 [Eubacteriales bacterium]
MLKIIIGVKGTGKTKALVEMVNSTAEKSEGAVVCLEKGEKLRYDVTYKARLVNTDEYAIADGEELYGFVAGIHASNHDITHIFIDSALKICRNDLSELDSFVTEMAALCENHQIDVVMTCSLAESDASELVKRYC